jgi:uroporphyrin-III C-methyltransferase
MTSIRLPKNTISFPNWCSRMLGYFRQHLVSGNLSDCNNDAALTINAERSKGSVLLVGAGPGDPDLLTVKALKALQQADVVLVDWLVSDAIVDLIPKHVEQRFVGKRAGHHSMSQQAICELMVELALQGNRVVRLKGGDPAVFGRTAEEAVALTTAGVQFALVPGITAASGASASSGIPLTHRACAQSVRMLTAHLKDPAQEPDWGLLVTASQSETQVFYMGLSRLNQIMQKLVAAGLPESMPVAVIDQATTPQQRVCSGNAKDIADKIKLANFAGPSLIVLGHVVEQRFNVSNSILHQLTHQDMVV